LNKSDTTINGWKKRQPALLDAVKLGIFCKKNDLDIDKIKKLIEIKEAVKGASDDK